MSLSRPSPKGENTKMCGIRGVFDPLAHLDDSMRMRSLCRVLSRRCVEAQPS